MPSPAPAPETARLRASIGALTRHRGPDDPLVAEARRDLRAERLAEHIAAAVSAAPPLTIAQRRRLAALLRGNGAGDG